MDVAACKPAPPPEPICRGIELDLGGEAKYCFEPKVETQPGCPGPHVSNLCFATKSVAGGYARPEDTGSPAASFGAPAALPIGDVQIVLP